MELIIENDKSYLQVIFGGLFMGLCSWIYLPTLPIPTTLQTFSLFILALTLGPRRAPFSVMISLLFLTPTWIIGPSAGYVFAFPFAAYVIGKMVECASPMKAIFCGQILIYTCGFGWLTTFMGWKEALIYGVVFFLPSALLKNFAAVRVVRRFR